MDKRPRPIWLFMQGYHEASLPPMVQWYAKGRTFKGRSNSYTLGLYRGKGFVLDERFLDPTLWSALEYRRELVDVRHAHNETKAPCPTIIELQGQPQEGTPLRTASALAREVISLMGEREAWQGTASDLLGLIDSTRNGVPGDPIRPSAKVVDPTTSDVLELHGIAVEKRRSNGKRLLYLTRITQ